MEDTFERWSTGTTWSSLPPTPSPVSHQTETESLGIGQTNEISPFEARSPGNFTHDTDTDTDAANTSNDYVKMPCGHVYLKTFVRALLDDPAQGRRSHENEPAVRSSATASSKSLRSWALAIQNGARISDSEPLPITSTADVHVQPASHESSPRLRSMLVIVCPAAAALGAMSGMVAMLLWI